jgi:4-alpha-glucanotransferase
VTTHDLPTSAGAWSGTDAEDQARIGLNVDPAEMESLVRVLEGASGLERGAAAADVIVATHRRLAAAPPALVTATLDDALEVRERPNMPGTIEEWPNWRLALPTPIDELLLHPTVRRVAAAMRDGRASPAPEPNPARQPRAASDSSPSAAAKTP